MNHVDQYQKVGYHVDDVTINYAVIEGRLDDINRGMSYQIIRWSNYEMIDY